MKILAIDTSAEACSAALLIDSELDQRLSREPRRSGELILGMMDELLQRAGLGVRQLDALAFGRGPGSFIGVRIATSVVQGAAFGADLPVVPVSTLAAVAQGQVRKRGWERILCAFDARMGEVYWGRFTLGQSGMMCATQAEQVATADLVALPHDGVWYGAGGGWAVHGDTLRRRLGQRLEAVSEDAVCEARDIATIAAGEFAAGHAVPVERALPVYLRDQVTHRR